MVLFFHLTPVLTQLAEIWTLIFEELECDVTLVDSNGPWFSLLIEVFLSTHYSSQTISIHLDNFL